MKTKTLFILSSLLLFMNCSYSQQNRSTTKTPGKMSNSISVIELFTSEGCSSCPAADALMPKLKEQYGDNLIVLSFHVDYWNRLGWKDVFSSADYTRRQNQYAAALQTDNIYTPQAVVNGRAHITGSNQNGVQELIEKTALAGSVSQQIELSAKSGGNRTVVVKFAIALKDGEVLNVALTQQHATTDVKRGENGGRKLEHYSVVRDFKTTAGSSGELTFALPDNLPQSDFHIVAFVQQKGNMYIKSVREIKLQ